MNNAIKEIDIIKAKNDLIWNKASKVSKGASGYTALSVSITVSSFGLGVTAYNQFGTIKSAIIGGLIGIGVVGLFEFIKTTQAKKWISIKIKNIVLEATRGTKTHLTIVLSMGVLLFVLDTFSAFQGSVFLEEQNIKKEFKSNRAYQLKLKELEQNKITLENATKKVEDFEVKRDLKLISIENRKPSLKLNSSYIKKTQKLQDKYLKEIKLTHTILLNDLKKAKKLKTRITVKELKEFEAETKDKFQSIRYAVTVVLLVIFALLQYLSISNLLEFFNRFREEYEDDSNNKRLIYVSEYNLYTKLKNSFMKSENNKKTTRAIEKIAITSRINQAQAEKTKAEIEAEGEIIEAEVEESKELLAVKIDYEKKIGAKNIEESKQFQNKLLEITNNQTTMTQSKQPIKEDYQEEASEKEKSEGERKQIGFVGNKDTLTENQLIILFESLIAQGKEIKEEIQKSRNTHLSNVSNDLQTLNDSESLKGFESCVNEIDNFKYSSLIKSLYRGGEVKANQKLTPRNQVIDTKVRKQDEALRAVYNILQENNIIRRDIPKGYYAVASMEQALNVLGGAK